MKLVVAIATLTFLFAPAASAQSEIWLQNGAIIQGKVLEDDGEKIKVEIVADGGTGATATYKYDQLHPHTIYRLKFNKTERDDVKGQIALANYALDNYVFASARLSYDLAKKANTAKKAGLDADIEKLHARAPAVILEYAKKHIATEDFVEAHRALRRLGELFPDREEGAEAAKLLDEIAVGCSTCQMDTIRKKAPVAKSSVDLMAPAKRQYDKAQATVRQAMTEYKKPVQVSRLLKTAITELETARKLLDEAVSKEAMTRELEAHHAAWAEKIKEETVDAYVSLSNSYFSRQSNKDALDAIHAALLIDPKNPEALATRGRIQVASSDTDRFRN